jgi:type II secretory pathway pseudopilin PulG
MIKNLYPAPSTLNPKSAGFTLIETLVLLLVFSVSLTAIFSLLTSNLKEASLIRNNFVASGLVQEGMEVVRNIRDGDWYAGRPFGSFGASGVTPDGTYRVQWDSQTLLPLESNPYLTKNSGTSLVSYDPGGNDTIFKRTITISSVSGAEKMVAATVTWSERGVPKSVSAEEHLYNWR